MCDPLTIGGIVLTAGSVAANTFANSQIDKSRAAIMAAERERQKGYDAEMDALNTASQDRYQNFGDQQAEKASQLADFFRTIEVGPSDVMPQSASNIVVNEGARQKAAAQRFGEAQANALANMRSFGDLLGGIGRLQARDAAQLGTIGGFKRASAELAGSALDAANSSAGGMKLLADLLGAAGSLGVKAGLSRGTYSPITSTGSTASRTGGGALNPFSLY